MADSADKVASLRLKIIDEFSSTTRKFTDEMKSVEDQSKKSTSSISVVSKATSGMKDAFSSAAIRLGVFTVAVTATAFAMKKLADGAIGIFKPFVAAGAQMESFSTRMTAMSGSVSGGADIMAYMVKQAEKIPATLDEVVAAGISLQSFGANVKETLPVVADLAGFMGTTLPEAASAFGKAFAGGAGAADIFRERGVMNLIKMKTGIDDLTKLSLPEFRKAMLDAFTEVGGGIAGMAEEMSKTWEGKISNIEDKMFEFKRIAADEIFPKVKAALGVVLDKLKEFSENGKLAEWAKSTGQLLGKLFDAMLGAVPTALAALGTMINIGFAFAKISAAAALAWNTVRLSAAGMKQGMSLGFNKEANTEVAKLLATEKALSGVVVNITEGQEQFNQMLKSGQSEAEKLVKTLLNTTANPGKDDAEAKLDAIKRAGAEAKRLAAEQAATEREMAAKKAGAAKEQAKLDMAAAKTLAEKRKATNAYFEEVFRQNKALFDFQRAASANAGIAGEADYEAERVSYRIRLAMEKEALQQKAEVTRVAIGEMAETHKSLRDVQAKVVKDMADNWDAYNTKIKEVQGQLKELRDRMFDRSLNQKDRFGGDRYDEDEKTLLKLIKFEEMYKKAMTATGDEQRRLMLEAIRYRETIDGEVTSRAIRSLAGQGFDTSGFSRTDAATLQKDLDALMANAEKMLIDVETKLIAERDRQYEADSAKAAQLQDMIDGAASHLTILRTQLQEFRMALAGKDENEKQLIVATEAAEENLKRLKKTIDRDFPDSGVKSKLEINVDPATRALDKVKNAIEDIQRMLKETGSIFGVGGIGDRGVYGALQDNAQAAATDRMKVQYGDARDSRAQNVTINVQTTGRTSQQIDAELADLWRRKSSKLRQAVAA